MLNEATLSYHRVRGLSLLAFIFAFNFSYCNHIRTVTGLKHDTYGYELGFGLGCRLGLICRCRIRGVYI